MLIFKGSAEEILPQVACSNERQVYENGEGLEFADMTVFDEAFYLAVRGSSEGGRGSIHLLKSEDTKEWELVHQFSVEGRDTREPHLLVFREKLFVLTETRDESDPDFNLRLGYTVVTRDGKDWSEPKLMEGTFGHSIGMAAISPDSARAHIVGRRKVGFKSGDLESVELESEDGVNWRAGKGMKRVLRAESAYSAVIREGSALVRISPTKALVAWCSTENGTSAVRMADLEISLDRSSYSQKNLERIDAADRILAEQRENGGWSKGTDDEDERRLLFDRRSDDTTLDNGTTHRHIKALAEAYSTFRLPRYRYGVEAGIEFLLVAQYRNGGWPQRYPKMKGYARYITFNDGAMVGALDVLLMVAEKRKPFEWVGDEMSSRAQESLARGIDCILKCQVVRNGVRTVWGQQHDEIDFRPQHARDFEPPSLCSSESAGIVRYLMQLESPSEAVVESIEGAMKWFEGPAKLTMDGKVTWARLYEIDTDRPIFGDRDRSVHYDLAEISEERRDGYAWYVTHPLKVIEEYAEWRRRLETDVTSGR